MEPAFVAQMEVGGESFTCTIPASRTPVSVVLEGARSETNTFLSRKVADEAPKGR